MNSTKEETPNKPVFRSGSVLQLKPDIPVWTEIFPTPHTPHPIPCLNSNLFVTPSGQILSFASCLQKLITEKGERSPT